ncbi:MAG: DUF4212 domain-containing protein, partial [Alphaproteobacteria bacterium]|nr:DUF4212 domain-containing protein [Alphaproteobacteria bacterium]
MSVTLPPEKAKAHWSRTKNLMFLTLAIWAFFGFVIHFFVGALNSIVIL